MIKQEATTAAIISKYDLSCRRALAVQARASGWSSGQVSFLQRQISSHMKDLRLLARRSPTGIESNAARKQERILRSFAARLCGTLYLMEDRRSAVPPCPMIFEDFESFVRTSPLVGNKPDPCRMFSLSKQNGEKRAITAPGPKTVAAQKTLVMALQVQGTANHYEFNCQGRGCTAALIEIKRLMIDEGLRWFVVFDLAEFFTSVKPEHLEGFKLPEEVLKNVVYFNRYATLVQHNNGKTKWIFGGQCNPARRGIPQGAPASGILASALLGRELRHLNGELGIVTYVDDGVIGARTQPEANKVAHALEKRFAKLSGGPIHFKHISVCDAVRGFAFLGYWVRSIEDEGEIGVRFTPSYQAKNKFKHKLLRRLRKKGPQLTWDDAMNELSEYRRNWMVQKPLWKPFELELVAFELETESWVDDYFNGFTKKLPPASEAIKDAAN